METSNFTDTQLTVREAIRQVCSQFPNEYWRQCDRTETDPKGFHATLAQDGWLGIALPEALGGAGLGISEATMMMQTIAESGAGMAGAQAIHANVYATQPLAKFGTKDQLESTIPNIISGQWRVCFGVTEPNAGLNTLALSTTADKQRDGSYLVTGQKIWITCGQVASKMILLARTTPLDQVKKPSEGLSLFCIDLDRRAGSGLDMRKIQKLGGRAVDANEVFFDHYPIPADSLIGREGQGFKIILHGMNAERCLLAGEALGLGYAALARAAQYARERVVFDRPIGQNQGIAHPLAEAYMQLESAKLSTYHAARLYDTAILTHGGMGYAAEYDVERCFSYICLDVAGVAKVNVQGDGSWSQIALPQSGGCFSGCVDASMLRCFDDRQETLVLAKTNASAADARHLQNFVWGPHLFKQSEVFFASIFLSSKTSELQDLQ
ncbi:unnamed protein product [Parascedosporium putredinis]|uniref:Acyl-CoA dehydrogenase n=1 Tax=Parascedosporium putredinis TaxID=1442378 RepID=A0A9P1H5P8_9PEZI|nr:unnamed protein product [Parascedosporium putredinis]CAI7997303.1 unnamed protein product [Parascedosporium putredinis]